MRKSGDIVGELPLDLFHIFAPAAGEENDFRHAERYLDEREGEEIVRNARGILPK